MQGEHYIRGLSDNELEKLVNLYRDMYSKEELQLADEELARRKRAIAAKADPPATTPQPSANPAAAPVAMKPETATAVKPAAPAANKVLPTQYVPRSRRTGYRKPITLNRSVVDEDYCMPPPEEIPDPMASQLTSRAYQNYNPQSRRTLIVRGKPARAKRSVVDSDYCMPPPEGPDEPEAPKEAGGAFISCIKCGNLCRREEVYCPSCGQKPR